MRINIHSHIVNVSLKDGTAAHLSICEDAKRIAKVDTESTDDATILHGESAPIVKDDARAMLKDCVNAKGMDRAARLKLALRLAKASRW